MSVLDHLMALLERPFLPWLRRRLERYYMATARLGVDGYWYCTPKTTNPDDISAAVAAEGRLNGRHA